MRTTFLIDGFNLYHSVRDASYDMGLNGGGTKWLDIGALCRSYLPLISKSARVEEIFYFSALARHLEASRPDTVNRHRSFIECLRATGVKVELGRFKRKLVWCPSCRQDIVHHEEKETDVAICAKLLELFVRDSCDVVVLMTGDTDLAPAVRTAQNLASHKQICFAFPYKRKNKELAKLVNIYFQIGRRQYLRHQLPDPFSLPSGRTISKPLDW